MRLAKPIDGVVIVTECEICHKAIVWSQYIDYWVHQYDYNRTCPNDKEPA